MSPSKPFRFGALCAVASSGQEWRDVARRAEAEGFSTLQIVDHLGGQLGPIAALSAAASVTTTLRIGSHVFGNDYRHPVMLAKECATLDVLSDGRLELGIGAGWDITDYQYAGLQFDRPAIRIQRLLESLQVLRGCLASGPFTYVGEHYSVREYDGQPEPVQRPHPPLLIGAGAERMLGIAGREADIVGLNFDLRTGRTRRPPGTVLSSRVAADGTADMVDRKLEWVRNGAGERFEALELNVTSYRTVITDDRAGAAERLASELDMSPLELLGMPFALIGSVDEIVDTLVERRERFGINYVTFPIRNVIGPRSALAEIVSRLAGT